MMLSDGSAGSLGSGVAVVGNPFPGLRSFEPDEDHLFFGRERQIDQLLRRLRSTRFLAVVGTSGSGKSSLVKSGLIPSLCSGYMVQAGSSWRIALVRPGADPIHNLSVALNEPNVLGGDPSSAELQGALLDATLRRSGQGLIDAVRERRLLADENLLVIVDQFEELFRFKQARAHAGGRDEAIAFTKLLLEAARQEDVSIYVVLTMRSEFIGACAELPGLPEAVNEGQYLVPRMTRDELRLAITGPVAVGGGVIAPRLVTRLLNEVGDDPDQLPVLQHALMRTWWYWSSHQADQQPIDFADYEAIGTMKAALSRHADEAYEEIGNDRGRHCCTLVFKALTETTGHGLGLRHPCRVDRLCAIADAPIDEMASVIDRFRMPGRSFLVPPIGTPLGPDTIVDVSHESLMRLWDRLVTWTEEEARSAQIYRRLSSAAVLHDRREAGLWRDPELQLAANWRDREHPTAAWARRYDAEFERVTTFLDDSIATRDAEIAVREAEAAARARQERKIRQQTLLVFAVSLLCAAVVVFFMIRTGRIEADAEQKLSDANQKLTAATETANSRLRDADTQVNAANAVIIVKEGQIADAEKRIATASTEAAVQKSRAMASLLATTTAEELQEDPAAIGTVGLLAIEALRLDPATAVARHTLIDVIQLLPASPIVPVKQGHSGPIQQMALDPTASWLVTFGRDRKIVLWDFRAHDIRRTIAENVETPLRDLAVSSDGRRIAAGSDSLISVWDAETGTLLKQVPVEQSRILALSPDGSRLAVINRSQQYKVFGTGDGQEIVRPQLSVAVFGVAFSPAGDEILQTTSGLRLASQNTDVADSAACHSIGFNAAGNPTAICPRGYTRFAVEAGLLQRKSYLEIPPDLTDAQMITFGGAGNDRELFIKQSKSQLSAFQRDGKEYLRFPRPVTDVAVPASGEWIASADQSGTVMFWRLAHGMVRPLPYEGDVSDVAFSHDERLLAVAEHKGHVAVFDTSTRHQIASFQVPVTGTLTNPRFSGDDSLFGALNSMEPPPRAAQGVEELHFFRTADWKRLPERTITASKDRSDLSFFFTPDKGVLVTAEQGLLRRFRIDSWTQLPTAQPTRDERLYVSKDRQWIAAIGDAKPAVAIRIIESNSGKQISPDQVPSLRGLELTRRTSSEIMKTLDEAKNAWVPLPDKNNKLSGDADGGDWWSLDQSTIGKSIIVINEKLTEHKVAGLEHETGTQAVAISRRGNWVASADTDGKVFLWPWSPQGLIDLACSLLPRNLTAEEWKARHLEELGLGSHRLTCPNLTPAPVGPQTNAAVLRRN